MHLRADSEVRSAPDYPDGVAGVVEPARAATEVAFTAPYVVIEGVYAVPQGSDRTTPADVDRAGVRIGVKKGSAYASS
ncbi:hypothetical protein [Nocardioides sp. InS609-2]|uniref:hypothetical protein n=1 Tax=Nocardioides sp. InS609-2 TaxID=2760705 RepID=UPI0020BDDC05|nr:hypothetical protein [Nocardioides sp. InS609-2]